MRYEQNAIRPVESTVSHDNVGPPVGGTVQFSVQWNVTTHAKNDRVVERDASDPEFA
jgi:hypothetical protein